MWKQFKLRFAPILGLLFLLFSFDSAFKFGTAFTLGCASRITLADLQGLNPRASAKRICGRPRGVRLGVHVFAVIWSSGAIVTDEDEMGLRLVASYADAFFEVDPDAPATTVKDMPAQFGVVCAKPLSCDEVVAQFEPAPNPTELHSEPQEEKLATRVDARWLGQIGGPQIPKPKHPNPVRMAQDEARERAIKQASEIGYKFGSTISGIESALDTLHSKCSRLEEDLRDNPDVLADWQKKIAQTLNDIPLPPQYADPELQGLAVGAFSRGFEDGFGDKKLQFMALNATATVSIVFFTSAFAVVETAALKTLRLALERVRTIPVYVPAMTNGAGFFLKVPKPPPANANAPALKFGVTPPPVASPPPFGNLSRAAEFGVKTYNQMVNAVKGAGLEVHHLIEQRFLRYFTGDGRINLSVAVTAAEHQRFTNMWRDAIGYANAGTYITNKDAILAAARDIYKDYPAILRALGL